MTGENVDIHTLERKDLIAGVIAKHKRFIEEYAEEFKELDNMTFTEYAEEKNIPESIQNDFYAPLIKTVTFMDPSEVSAGQYLYSEN